ncbi:MAG: hypothetical protein JXA66_00030 [Oligoflexia bacterium]|nr:hypothetical protein [Oligoflexia bacterium]
MNYKQLRFFLSSFLIYTISCSTTSMVVNLTSDALKKGISAFFEEDDLILARKGLESNLKLLEVFHKANPDNTNLTTLLSQAYGGYTFIFLETDLALLTKKSEKEKLQKRISKFYTRGVNYGLASLKHDSSKAVADIENNDISSLESSAKGIRDKEALFWTIFNWSLLLNFNRTSPDIVSKLPQIKILTDRMIELEKDFFYGAPLALKGTLECAMPRMLGGKPDLGVKLMEEALTSGKRSFLVVQMLYAQYCSPAVQDKILFNTLFDEIDKADYRINDNVVLINIAVKNRADFIRKETALMFIDMDDDEEDNE